MPSVNIFYHYGYALSVVREKTELIIACLLICNSCLIYERPIGDSKCVRGIYSVICL